MIKKLLVANRGEIACRIFSTAKQLGIKTVAIFAGPDANALHVTLADEAYALAGASNIATYLNIEQILHIAKTAGVDAIHPGYGFLAENAEFATACQAHKIIFVGPSAEAIAKMASKLIAKQTLATAGIPVLPGYHAAAQNDKTLLKQAQSIGFPLLIKAALGGGGKGMRLVQSADDFLADLAACKREAKKSFANDTVILERYLAPAKHIEVQILRDLHGNGVYLFERNCSMQRRQQKIIEEAPANITDKLRHQLGATALKIAELINYTNAGTIEFLVTSDQDFYFLEMNTRLQVEHPVTEYITNLDLVAQQLQIASGMPLAFTQHELRIHGHAIEARIYAEDPYHDFLPTTGKIHDLHWPTSTNVRVDHGLQVGDNIGIYYDPMLAKIISHGADRNAAIANLSVALADTQITGVKTNLAFLQQLLTIPAFVSDQITTDFLAKNKILPTDATTTLSSSDPWQILPNWRHFNLLDRYGSSTEHVRMHAAEQHAHVIVTAPMPGVIIKLNIATHDKIQQGESLLILEAMKMEHVVSAPRSGKIINLRCTLGDIVQVGDELLTIE